MTRKPKPVPVETIPLSEAVFCESCSVIMRARNDHCPVCAGPGGALLSLAALLNRPAAPQIPASEEAGYTASSAKFDESEKTK